MPKTTTVAPGGSPAGEPSQLLQQRLTKLEAARYLGVTERFIRDRMEDGTLAYHKLGRLVRLDVADLDKYLAATRVSRTAE